MKNSNSIIAIAIICLVVIFGGIAFIWSHTNNIPSGVPTLGDVGTTTVKTFTNAEPHFSIQYPGNFTVNTQYLYQELGPNKTIAGVSFTIPKSLTEGTNLSSDSFVSVESLPLPSCTALTFLGETATTSKTVVENGVAYDVAEGVGAAAGNIYDEYVYAIQGSHPCTIIRYVIHSGNIANYPPGAVSEFNKFVLVTIFDAMRHTYKALP